MTFKPLDMQMSVPRTQEYSGLQGQAAHKPLADQSALAGQASKETEQLRTKNTAVEQTTGQKVRSDQEQSDGSGSRYSAARKRTSDEMAEEQAEEKPAHPFKGHNLDIKL
ncbi:hypothetical protein [Paenibacillus harenae]|uniref:RNA polymerase subunit sigma n=1 Tax=Paenibacillus harenae TaxID=306543 RepID=A0ABT9U0K9_PAEHA|nr:hypothetical protein [Paenibacillus harenae]MDQ0059689.1 hypothetical protein [Paenibacillus harenae]MDQ0113103.1 hypothetical protein [Paenibacillus harenae]